MEMMNMIATATEIQNNFGKYLQLVQNGEDVIVSKNGKEVARIIAFDKTVSFLTDSLIGVLKGNYDDKDAYKERIKKYESVD